MLAASDRYDAVPTASNGTAVLLIAGSSGRLENERADLLAGTGARVRTIRWFGGVAQRPAPHEVPLELFAEQLNLLRAEHDRVVFFGTSFGAEAALATAARVPVDAVIAVAPSSVVWAGAAEGTWSSHWTYRGELLPRVSFDPQWHPDAEPPAFRGLYESSLRRHASQAATARITVEEITGEVLLVAGGDDQVWPSDAFARQIVDARAAAGLTTTLVQHSAAGHRLLLPGETPATGGVHMRRGGSPAADAALGAQAWPHIRRILGDLAL